MNENAPNAQGSENAPSPTEIQSREHLYALILAYYKSYVQMATHGFADREDQKVSPFFPSSAEVSVGSVSSSGDEMDEICLKAEHKGMQYRVFLGRYNTNMSVFNVRYFLWDALDDLSPASDPWQFACEMGISIKNPIILPSLQIDSRDGDTIPSAWEAIMHLRGYNIVRECKVEIAALGSFSAKEHGTNRQNIKNLRSRISKFQDKEDNAAFAVGYSHGNNPGSAVLYVFFLRPSRTQPFKVWLAQYAKKNLFISLNNPNIVNDTFFKNTACVRIDEKTFLPDPVSFKEFIVLLESYSEQIHDLHVIVEENPEFPDLLNCKIYCMSFE